VRSSRLTSLFAYEHLHIKKMIKNHHLAKSIHDASWGLFLSWVRNSGTIESVPVIAVPAAYTSQDCSGCVFRVWKSLSVRTHICPNCGLIMDRDENSAVSIRDEGIRTWGHQETGQGRAPLKRFWTTRLYERVRKGTRHSSWLKEEFPAFRQRECQLGT
jgi:putative transposase